MENKENVKKKKVDIKIVGEKKEKELPKKSNDKLNGKKGLNSNLFEMVVLIVISILLILLLVYFFKDRNENNETDYSRSEIATFIEQYNFILENYYGDIDKDELISNAINGMLSSLDDYSELIDGESNNFDITLTGSYEGVGIGINNTLDGDIIITQVYDNTPAQNAGLKYGDIIVKFNDEELINVTSSNLVDKIAAEKEIKLTILREGETFDVTLKKRLIELQSVYYEIIENDIGYVRVSIFALNTYNQFKKALQALDEKNIDKLIIDLRDNSGGHLSAVHDMLSLFMDSNHVIYQTEDKNGVEKYYSEGNKNREYNIVILQNELTASASEIMAASLRENLNAYIIGKTSTGKGTVQQLKDVGDIQYKITTKKWLTPNGNWVNENKIVPDLEVDLSLNDIDTQYKAAIEYFQNL